MRAQENLGKTVTIRTQARATANPTGKVVQPHEIVDYTAVVDDIEHPANEAYKWLQLAADQFVNYIYPPNGLRFDLLNDAPPPPPPPASLQAREKLGKTVSIRSQPSASGAATSNVVLPYQTVTYIATVDDLDHPGDASYKWLQLGTNQYANYIYPPDGLRFDLVDDTSPPTSTSIHHIEVVYTDGTRDKFVPE